jgi:hypothetical protein
VPGNAGRLLDEQDVLRGDVAPVLPHADLPGRASDEQAEFAHATGGFDGPVQGFHLFHRILLLSDTVRHYTRDVELLQHPDEK